MFIFSIKSCPQYKLPKINEALFLLHRHITNPLTEGIRYDNIWIFIPNRSNTYYSSPPTPDKLEIWLREGISYWTWLETTNQDCDAYFFGFNFIPILRRCH